MTRGPFCTLVVRWLGVYPVRLWCDDYGRHLQACDSTTFRNTLFCFAPKRLISNLLINCQMFAFTLIPIPIRHGLYKRWFKHEKREGGKMVVERERSHKPIRIMLEHEACRVVWSPGVWSKRSSCYSQGLRILTVCLNNLALNIFLIIFALTRQYKSWGLFFGQISDWAGVK